MSAERNNPYGDGGSWEYRGRELVSPSPPPPSSPPPTTNRSGIMYTPHGDHAAAMNSPPPPGSPSNPPLHPQHQQLLDYIANGEVIHVAKATNDNVLKALADLRDRVDKIHELVDKELRRNGKKSVVDLRGLLGDFKIPRKIAKLGKNMQSLIVRIVSEPEMTEHITTERTATAFRPVSPSSRESHVTHKC